MKRINFKKAISNVLVLLVGGLLALLLLELGLRVIKPYNQFYSMSPNMAIEATYRESVEMPGIAGRFRFTTNEHGYRSKNLFSTDRYGILSIGGSTTECAVLGDDLGWTQLLENQLNEDSQKQFTVGNAGVSGYNSSHHLLQMKHLVPQYEHIDAVLVLLGINDFVRFMEMDSSYFPSADDPMLMRRAFKIYPPAYSLKWYQKTQLWTHLRFAYNNYKGRTNRLSQEEGIEAIQQSRQQRLVAEKWQALPEMDQALEDYRNTLKEMVALSKIQNVKLALATQPVFWKANMTAEETRLTAIILPMVKGKAYPPHLMAIGMEMFNDVVREIANADENIILIDLAAELPKDTSVFYDHCHFNQSGSKQVTQLMYRALKDL